MKREMKREMRREMRPRFFRKCTRLRKIEGFARPCVFLDLVSGYHGIRSRVSRYQNGKLSHKAAAPIQYHGMCLTIKYEARTPWNRYFPAD